jgi:hypothetical protein
MKSTSLLLYAAIAATSLVCSGTAEAGRQHSGRGHVSGSVHVGVGHHHHHHRGMWHRPWGPRLMLSFPIGVAPYYYPNGVYYGPAGYAGYTVVPPPPGAEEAQGRMPEPVAKAAPDPVIYPRDGQSAQQTEADRQECNRWATTQPSAMADASVFHRAVAACMDGRGYSLK